MIVASVLRNGWMYPYLVMPSSGAPWAPQSVHVSAGAVLVALWLAAILGGGGVAAGLVAVRRGARLRVRVLLAAALIAVAALTVLPPAGSTDALDYAAYGRIVVLGHSPYVMTPYHLRIAHNAFARSVPRKWDHLVSVYGPLATAEQSLAARLGGTSAARIVFWLKLWNAIAFGMVAIVIDRLLRSDPAQRLRAHLLWTINPLLLWGLIAAGHLDVLAAAAGVLGLIMVGQQSGSARPRLLRALAAGALLGVAADIKINYVIFGLGLAWALRRSPAALAAAAGGALAALLPSYAWFGRPAVRAVLARRSSTSRDNFYQVFIYSQHHWGPQIALIAAVLVAAVALLLLRRLPDGDQTPALLRSAIQSALRPTLRPIIQPAIRPTLALSAAWLFFWPYQWPWYDVMIVCLLVLYPASRLDWLVLARLTAATFADMPGNPVPPRGHVLAVIDHANVEVLAPLVMLCAAIGLVVLCLSGQWRSGQPDGPPGTAAPGPVEMLDSATG